MSSQPKRLILFTDLDGCLLNKHDYDWSPAAAALDTLRRLQVPVVMNSSKTVAEMCQLAEELGLTDQTFISENGAVIRWGEHISPDGPSTEIVGCHRDAILTALKDLKSQFQFHSFADLGLAGVIEATQLPEPKAQLALQRQGTEPLLWEDTDQQRNLFASELQSQGFTLTKGGRFWHVAGKSTKGKAMQIVAKRLSDHLVSLSPTDAATIITAAIGDSPIDQSMLDVADVPIGIPTAAGLGVEVRGDSGIVPQQTGAAGWAEAVELLLSRLRDNHDNVSQQN